MKKIFLIVQPKDSSRALESLQDLGIVHVEHQRAAQGESVAALKAQIVQLRNVIDHLAKLPATAQESIEHKKEFLNDISAELNELQQLRESVMKRQQVISVWQPWGAFCPEDIRSLAEKGFYVQLFKIPEAQIDSLPEGVACEKVFVQEKIAYCLVVSSAPQRLAFEEISLPSSGLADMQGLQQQEQTRIAELEQNMQKSTAYLQAFQALLIEKDAELKFQEALAGMGDEESLQYLKGFSPAETITSLQSLAREKRWGLVIEDPDDEDKVPTLLRNPQWVTMIKPVFGMMNVVPGYHEKDISLLFLVFFSLFFGILIGDAGYGLVILMGTAFFHWKSRAHSSNLTALRLMYLLSGCTILWGSLTGVFFGQAWLPNSIKPLVPWLADTRNLQLFCFFIGALHLSLAHIWKALLKMPSVEALAEMGWMMIIWFMFFLAQKFILSVALPSFAVWLVYIGSALVVLFHQPARNVLKRIGSGLGALLLSIVNMFTDVVSYIRLAAVGVASLAVADAFNQMALGLGFKSFLSGFFVVAILFFGHALNLTLGFMAIIVHGIRLNILEFSSHLNMEWSGISYEPLARPKK